MKDEEKAADLVAAIDRLTAEVAGVRTALEALASSGASPGAVAAVAPRAAALATAVGTAASQVGGMAPSIETVAADRQADAIEQLLAFLFMAALDPDDEAGFENFVSAMHSDRTDAPRSIPSLREFNWRALRRNAPKYLSDPSDATSFTVVSRRPDAVTAEDRNVKVFLSCPGRSPVPVTLKRDARHDDAWRVTDSSL